MYSWDSFDHIYSINSEGKDMEFRFVPAQNNPEKAPTMIILHGHGNYPPARFVHPDWNVFNPLDNFGEQGYGSWWLGEDGDYFTMRLFDIALSSALSRVGQNKDNAKLFMYGSSMGGYGVLLHGSRIGAKGVYANVPQVKLLNSTYSELGMKRYFEPIFSKSGEDIHNDMVDYLAKSDNHPLYFICENRFGQDDYLAEQSMYLVDFFNKNEINYHLEIIPTKGRNKNRRLSEVKAMFELYCGINED